MSQEIMLCEQPAGRAARVVSVSPHSRIKYSAFGLVPGAVVECLCRRTGAAAYAIGETVVVLRDTDCTAITAEILP